MLALVAEVPIQDAGFYRAVAASLVFEFEGDAPAPAAVTLHQNGRRIRCPRQADDGR